ncbi:hypothetical protein Bphyt_3724 [Paraburkholderia phytofirmans PsJN]|uniref:Uncharacterized protein n=1 Tax=Paraburkholderia phytofirmans (strain DSM 17436 / LMG 22146 / PsJN) TaxID=398527 RepID=B2T6U0_PARPJ|nr:hypothetical protein Bphyt_3724 [Paraburkholderia phytofirmans PsJN]
MDREEQLSLCFDSADDIRSAAAPARPETAARGPARQAVVIHLDKFKQRQDSKPDPVKARLLQKLTRKVMYF